MARRTGPHQLHGTHLQTVWEGTGLSMAQEITVSDAEVRDGEIVVIKTTTIRPDNCPHFIFVSEHYREDGSCLCSNAEHRAKMMSDWEYTEDDFKGVALID